MSRMPRSGSTLLCNILNQNPRFLATGTSPTPDLLLTIKNFWNSSPETKATKSQEDLLNVLRGTFEGMHSGKDKDVIFDKSLGWVSAFELAEYVLGYKPKILVTIRDIPSILSSCEKLFRKELNSPNSSAKFGSNMETLEGRLAHWTAGDQLVGGSFNRIRDCVRRGHRESLHFVDFDSLTSSPDTTMQGIYEFLQEDYFQHNFENVEQSIQEDDSQHGFLDLHTIRPKVDPLKKDFKTILGDAVRPYTQYTYDFI